ncbi:sulfite exporter TauE/SafE family protein [Glaciecola sp. 1036]|uniref:sulfite exporter TauE/SafE family protein n=1 Tax=Alteromonadaceae TaxID=72275 RepID=UPI003CFCAD49
MSDLSIFSAFLVGLAGSVHCIGMCGGVISAFSFATPPNANKQLYSLAYNLGRILTYAFLGAITGYLGSIVSSSLVTDVPVLRYVSIAFLFLLAFYISGIWRLLSHLEAAGKIIWKRIQPLSKKFLPAKTPFHAIAYGAIWGFLPCGLIYSALTWSLASGSATQGALLMFSFGLGTLPSLLIISFGLQSLLPYFQHPISRYLIAASIFLSGLILLFQEFGVTV